VPLLCCSSIDFHIQEVQSLHLIVNVLLSFLNPLERNTRCKKVYISQSIHCCVYVVHGIKWSIQHHLLFIPFSDLLNVPTSGYSKQNQVFTQESPKKSFHCNRCILLFKSKVYLFEHLNKVHSCDVDAALREAGLKYPENNKANTESNTAEDDFECQLCDFKAYSRDILNEHERQCHKKSEDVIGNLIISESPETSIIVMSSNQQSDSEGAKEISSVFSVTSTSKSLCTLNSSKDLKTYKRPLKTIDQYFAAPPGSNGKPPGNSAESPNLLDGTKGTIILKESPSSSSPNRSGVFKVTAKSMIDITGVSHSFLQNDQLKNTDLRTNSAIPKSPPAKKAKSYKEETKLPREEHATEQQSSSNTEFPFDISEDEGEKKPCLVNGDSESSTVYYCKHCVYSDVSLACASAHYQNDHPYVRYNAAYIRDPCDSSATFRCLHCPVEFLGVAGLKRHYSTNHPEAPNVFAVQSRELSRVLKCFVCVFTTDELKALKTHYKEIHPTHGVENSLLFCRYLATECQEGSTQSNVCEKPLQNAPSARHPTAAGADAVLYHCNTCKFSHKSVIVMHVHYQKCHPGQEITIDKIKQSACVTPDKSPNSVTITEESAPQTNVHLSCNSASDLFFCQFCSYSSTNIKSVLGHHNAKHSLNALTCMEEILCYSAQVQKKKLQSEARASAKPASFDSKTSKQVEVHREEVPREEDDAAADAPVTGDNAYACAENMFYCQKCNYGNPSLKGIVNHQSRIHKHFIYSRGGIIEHTAAMRDQIQKSKSHAKEFSFSTHLPLPLVNEGDENVFFCHFCNYRQSTVDSVLRHYIKKHRGFVLKAEQIRLHTAMVRKKTMKPDSETRTLSCYRCAYSTQYVYVLRRHIWKIHRTNRSITDVLRVCFKQGTLQTGYHCDVCVFSHESAAPVHEHYKEQHPGRNPSLEYVTTRLYVGPDARPPPRRKPQMNEAKTYPCRACSFKSGSVSGITRHYRAVHPWSVKEDGSVLGVVNSKRPSANRQPEDSDVAPESFESYQEPLEFDAADSSKCLDCPYCPAKFSTQHGLNTHCGMKHHEAEYENSDQNQKKIQTHMPVFKCPHCVYVNTSHQGVLSHCHMKHTDLLAFRADGLHVEEVQVSDWGDCLKRKGPGYVKLSGYRCETCPQVCATLEKLNKHCEKGHTQTAAVAVPSTPPEPAPEPAPQPSPVGKRKQYVTLGNREAVSQASFLSKKIYTVVKCQYCMYSCSTKIALDRHVRVHHKTASVSKAQDCAYKCVLCSSSYYTKILLGSHYVKRHGRDSFLKYYAPASASEQPSKSETPVAASSAENDAGPESPAETCQPNTLSLQNKVTLYKCHLCSYKGFYRRYLLCHFKKTHKLDPLTTHKLLQKYNKRKRVLKLPEAEVKSESEERAPIKCKKCPELIFDSSQLLVAHYSTFHGSDCILDFTVLSRGMKKGSTGLYRCVHCNKQMNGIRKLCSHLDCHRETARNRAEAAKTAASPKVESPSTCVLVIVDELPVILSFWMFLFSSINKFVIYKPGTIKPFLCSFCSYRTTLMGLWSRHYIVVYCAPTESLYLEPPDVQRQLNHYSSMAQADSPSRRNARDSKLPDNRLLHCEFCNFNTEHLSSQRRHYLNRHGKKILRCKDCEFFTAFRKTLERHMKAGHSTRQSEPTREKDLRCPFCLYQTKSRNNMIDHIVLHREERVVPIEVRRPKLSRYLKGLVFRCHKCTFSSGSADNLRLHMTKHDDIKPYKCRLCYFDCTWLSDLEAHLSDKHQVVRNHELVGQVSLDQLQARVVSSCSSGALAVTAGAEASCPAAAEEKPFMCEFCGRNLMNGSDLERHIKTASNTCITMRMKLAGESVCVCVCVCVCVHKIHPSLFSH
uniref:C2H2-type domain-containing protein n=1 Tax=Cyclopterus lumpus TaxID=8103 RepID=A0A8C2WE48_CYCLU